MYPFKYPHLTLFNFIPGQSHSTIRLANIKRNFFQIGHLSTARISIESELKIENSKILSPTDLFFLPKAGMHLLIIGAQSRLSEG